MAESKTVIIEGLIRSYGVEDFYEPSVLRSIYDGESPSDEMVKRVRTIEDYYHGNITAEEKEALDSATHEELRDILAEYISDFVEETMRMEEEDIAAAVSDWLDQHAGEDDFNSEEEREDWLADLSQGVGDFDYVFTEIKEDPTNHFEDIVFLDEEEIDVTIENYIMSEASMR